MHFIGTNGAIELELPSFPRAMLCRLPLDFPVPRTRTENYSENVSVNMADVEDSAVSKKAGKPSQKSSKSIEGTLPDSTISLSHLSAHTRARTRSLDRDVPEAQSARARSAPSRHVHRIHGETGASAVGA